ncbi:MAG: protein-L-isoaspartate O-methyltransferase [Alphaproteobacteria bacterium]|nr:protein-L-isoaspartate O-methyltransferase [Alphaproteobacteria bacterium]
MVNDAKARTAMIDGQLRPAGVNDPALLGAFGVLPMEAFLPPGFGGMAYADDSLSLGGGYALPAPLVIARLIQAARPRPRDVAFVVGDVTGYAAGLLSGLVSTVITVLPGDEAVPKSLADQAGRESLWAQYDLCNIAPVGKVATDQAICRGPFDIILICGAVAAFPPDFISRLSPGGRMTGVLRENPESPGVLSCLERDQDHFSTTGLFDAATPYVPGFSPAPVFAFG